MRAASPGKWRANALAAKISPFYAALMVLVITLLIAGTFLVLAEVILPGMVAGLTGVA